MTEKMDWGLEELESLLMHEHSGVHTHTIAQLAVENEDLLDGLFSVTLSEKEPEARRAAWPLRKVFDRAPELLVKYRNTMVEALPSIHQEAVLRNYLAILARMEIPESLQGKLLDFCLGVIQRPEAPIAVIANSIEICYTISKDEPSLLHELWTLLELIEPGAPKAVTAKMRIIQRRMKHKNSHRFQ